MASLLNQLTIGLPTWVRGITIDGQAATLGQTRGALKNGNMKNFIAAALLVLTGCATPKPHISPVGNGAYTVTQRGIARYARFEDLKEIALSEARIYCLNRHKTLDVVSTKEVLLRASDKQPEAEVVFSCK